jgi:hypothetical protein
VKNRIIILAVAAVVLLSGVGVWLLVRDNGDQPAQKDSQAQQDTAPTIQLDVPQDSLLLSRDKQVLQVAIKVDNYSKIARVEYLVDGTFTTYSTNSPFTVDITISQLSAGTHSLQAVAYSMSGKVGKSEVFTFTITDNQAAAPADDSSRAIVRNSKSISSLEKTATNSSGSSNGDNGGGPSPDPDPDTTPWPDTPAMAQICGNTTLLSGPVSAPAGAVVVPPGDNSSINLELNNTTYWFAPGVHTIGSGEFSQIEAGSNTTYVGGPGAILDGQGLNKYAFTQHATNVKIQYLTIINFISPRDEGVVNHNSGVGWIMEYNTMQNNGGGAVFAGSDNVVRYNCLKDNGQYGFQVYADGVGGPSNVVLDHNEVAGNNTADYEAQFPGCGCTGGGKFWEATNVVVSNNYVHNNLSVGLWADTNDTDFLVEGNYISNNQAQGLFYEIAYNMIVRGNNFIGNGIDIGPANTSFPTAAIYLSEAGGDSRVTGGRTTEIEIYNNNFEDNWAGVVLWENADRFCGSPSNTSGGTCTLVNPNANLTTCNDPALGGTINGEPIKSDCRWKTQNVKVHDNVFITSRDKIPDCTTSSSCGYQGIFSNVGTFPSWSPYMGSGIQQAITFNQNNLFSNNTYLGDWKFMAVSQGTNYNFAIWQAGPYNQDVGSTYNGKDHLVVANAVDLDTATLEGSIGEWISWFSATVSRSSAEAHTGTHSLKVDITAQFGWGVQLNDPSGFPITPAEKTISYWVKLGSGTNLFSRMDVRWIDENGTVIGTTAQLLSPALTTNWQQVSTTATPPAGAKSASIVIVHSSGTAGNSIYIDDVVIGDQE